jgi:hypothetical protein
MASHESCTERVGSRSMLDSRFTIQVLRVLGGEFVEATEQRRIARVVRIE